MFKYLVPFKCWVPKFGGNNRRRNAWVTHYFYLLCLFPGATLFDKVLTQPANENFGFVREICRELCDEDTR